MADAQDSGSCVRKDVEVQVLSPALTRSPGESRGFFISRCRFPDDESRARPKRMSTPAAAKKDRKAEGTGTPPRNGRRTDYNQQR